MRSVRLSQIETEPVASGPPRRVGVWRWLRRFGPFLPLTLGLVLTVAGAAKVFFPPVPEEAAPLVLESVAASMEVESAAVPDVLGLAEDVARAALVQAGVNAGLIEVALVPYAAPLGSVVTQSVPPGVPVEEGTRVSLGLAAELVMPQVAGLSRSSALETLAGLGVVPVLEEVVLAGGVVDEVIATSPGSGEPVAGQVRMTVVGSGDAVFLSDLRSVDGRYAGRDEGVVAGGETFMHAVLLQPRQQAPSFVDYVLSGHALTMELSVGTLDEGDSGSAMVTVRADDGQVAEVVVSRGEVKQLTVEVAGRTRVVVEAAIAEDSQDRPTVVLGDARVSGTSAGIDSIVSATGRN